MKTTKRFYKIRLAASIAACALALSGNVYSGQDAIELDIKSQNTGSALLQLAEDSGVHIVFSPDVAKENNSPAIQGTLSLRDALDKLLEGTNLSYSIDSDNVVLIKERDEQSTESDDEVDEEVVVLGARNVVRNRTKAVEPTLVYEGSYFERFEPLTLNDMLKRVPGVFFDRLFNLPSRSSGGGGVEPRNNLPRFRNLSSAFSQILVNGRQLAGVDFGRGGGVNFLTTIPAESVQSIEVIRSPSAAVDSSGVGLTLNVVLKDGSKYQSNTWRAGLASYDGNINGVGSVNFSGSTDTFNYNLGLTYQERESGGRDIDDQFIAFGGNETLLTVDVPSQGLATDINLVGSVGFDVGESGNLQLEGQYFQTDTDGGSQVELTVRRASGVTVSEQFTESTEDNSNTGLAATYQYEDDNFSWESVIGWNQSKQDSFVFNVRNSQPGGTRTVAIDEFLADSVEYRLDNRFSWDLGGDGEKIEAGFTWRNNDLDSSWNRIFAIDAPDDLRANYTQSTERLDLFALYEVNLTSDLSMQLGGRYETADYDSLSPSDVRFNSAVPGFAFDPTVFGPGSASTLDAKLSGFNPSIHFKWSFADNQDLRLSLAQTVRRPNLDELDPQVRFTYRNRPSTTNPNIIFGNPDLENEVSLGLDIGYDWFFNNGGVLGVNLFRRDIEDRITDRRLNADQLRQIQPRAAAEIDRFLMFIEADPSFAGDSTTAQFLTSVNSENETKAQGVEVDLSAPLSFISDNANIYFNATYSTQQATGESSERSTAINLSYDHLIESIGLTYGFSYNQITNFETSSINLEFGQSNTFSRELDPNLEIFVEQKFNENLVARLSVENILDAKENVVTTSFQQSSGFTFNTDGETDTSPRVLLTFRGSF